MQEKALIGLLKNAPLSITQCLKFKRSFNLTALKKSQEVF